MTLTKIVSLIFGFLFLINPFVTIYARNNNTNVPFDVNQVIEQVTAQQKSHHPDHQLQFSKSLHQISEDFQGEFMLDTTRVYIPAYGSQWYPSVAFDGTNYFVVWMANDESALVGARVSQNGEILDKSGIIIAQGSLDIEAGSSTVAFGDDYFVVWVNTDNDKIYGARVNTAGVLLDTTPIAICTTNSQQYYPSVAFGVSDFFVIWTDDRNPSGSDIYGTRVNRAGVVLDSSGIPIAVDTGYQHKPAVFFGGENYFVTWLDGYYLYRNIDGARVNLEGEVLDTAGILILSGASPSSTFITFGGSNYFVVWDVSGAGIYGTRVNQNGVVLDTNGIAISTGNYGQTNPIVTFDGTNYFAVWEDYRDYSDIYGARIDTSGMVLDPSGIEISIASVTENLVPSVAFGGANYFVAWTLDEDKIIGARVNSAGTVLDSSGLLVSYGVNQQDNSSIAFDGNNYFVAWCDLRNDTSYICGVRVSPAGNIVDSTVIKISAVMLLIFPPYLQVTYGNGNYLIVWNDFRTGFPHIYAARVSTEGTLLDTISLSLSDANAQWYPKAAFDGSNYFVVWYDDRGDFDIYGTRVSTAGVVLDPQGIPISTAFDWQANPEVIFDGTNYFVCWDDQRNGGYQNSDIYGTRVSTAGVVLEPDGIPISTAINNQWFPKIAFDSMNYFVVWEDYRNGLSDIYGARLSSAGVVLDTAGISISSENESQNSPRVAFGDDKYFVVWSDSRNGVRDIYGARLTTDGLVLDQAGILISTRDYVQVYPQVVFDGAYYVAVWQRGYYSSDVFDIYGARVNPENANIDSFSITAQPGKQNKVAIAHGSNNQVFATYTGWSDVYQSKSFNTYRIWGKFAPLPGVEESKITADLNSAIFMSSPNPFNNSTLIRYSVKNSGDVSIKIFDIAGKLVRNIVNGNKKPGVYSINWNGTDDLNKKLPAGVYFYRLKTSNETSKTKQLIILR